MDDLRLSRAIGLSMGIVLGLAVVLMAVGIAWQWLLFWGVALLLAVPMVGVIAAMVGMARARHWRYFLLGMLLLALAAVAVLVGFFVTPR